jgi:hypothetical protein
MRPATQAEMEAGSDLEVFVPPGRQHLHPGHPKAWVSFDGSGTLAINRDYGVASVTDNGTGNYTAKLRYGFCGHELRLLRQCSHQRHQQPRLAHHE